MSLAGTVNMAGGQPVSMANVREIRELCEPLGIKVMLDATRMVENALFIQEREEGYADKSIAQILLEFCSYTDGAWMSAKKDNLVNIGGWLAVNDWDTFEELRNLVVVFEGLHTYGGLAGRDMEALALGIEEAVQDEHVRSRVGQVRYLGELLELWDIPMVKPIGGHAVFLDAKALLSASRAGRVPRRRRWRRCSTWTPGSARWSGGSCPQAATPRPATTSARSSSSPGSRSRGASTRRRTWTSWPSP